MQNSSQCPRPDERGSLPDYLLLTISRSFPPTKHSRGQQAPIGVEYSRAIAHICIDSVTKLPSLGLLRSLKRRILEGCFPQATDFCLIPRRYPRLLIAWRLSWTFSCRVPSLGRS